MALEKLFKGGNKRPIPQIEDGPRTTKGISSLGVEVYL